MNTEINKIVVGEFDFIDFSINFECLIYNNNVQMVKFDEDDLHRKMIYAISRGDEMRFNHRLFNNLPSNLPFLITGIEYEDFYPLIKDKDIEVSYKLLISYNKILNYWEVKSLEINDFETLINDLKEMIKLRIETKLKRYQ